MEIFLTNYVNILYLLFPNPDFVFLPIVIVTFVNFRWPLYHVQIFCIFGDIDTFYPIIFVHRLAWLGSAIVNTLTWVVASLKRSFKARLIFTVGDTMDWWNTQEYNRDNFVVTPQQSRWARRQGEADMRCVTGCSFYCHQKYTTMKTWNYLYMTFQPLGKPWCPPKYFLGCYHDAAFG